MIYILFLKIKFFPISDEKTKTSSKKLFKRLSENKSHSPLVGNMADVLNETEILEKLMLPRNCFTLQGRQSRSSLWHAIESFLQIDTDLLFLLLSCLLNDFDLYIFANEI